MFLPNIASIFRPACQRWVIPWRCPCWVGRIDHCVENSSVLELYPAFHYYINRMLIMPISVQDRKQEWNRILIMARNNRFPTQLLLRMKKQIKAKKERTQTGADQQHSKKWVTLTFHNPSIHKITNLFKKTNLKIAFRKTNTIYQQL